MRLQLKKFNMRVPRLHADMGKVLGKTALSSILLGSLILILYGGFTIFAPEKACAAPCGYTDADAIAAVQAEATLILSGDVTIGSGSGSENGLFIKEPTGGGTDKFAIRTSNISADRFLDIPGVSQNSTFAFLEEDQTFSGDQTFTGSVTISVLVASASFDLNGVDLILDVDADSTIDGAVDDQLRITLGATETLDYTLNAFAFQVNTTISSTGILTVASPTFTGTTAGTYNLGGTPTVISDITFNDSVRATFGTGGDSDIYYDGTDLLIEPRVVGSGNVVINDAASFIINDIDAVDSTVAIVVQQGAADDTILVLRSTDVTTGLSTVTIDQVDTDDYLTIGKRTASQGGVLLQVLNEDSTANEVFRISVYGGTANTSKATDAQGLIHLYAAEHNGSGGLTDIPANGNIFVVQARTGGSNLARFIVDAEGDGTFFGDLDIQGGDITSVTSIVSPGDLTLHALSGSDVFIGEVGNTILTYDGGTNSIGIGVSPTAVDFISTGGSFTSDGSDTTARYLNLAGTLTGAAGDTNSLYGSRFTVNIITQSATETVDNIAQLILEEPQITKFSGIILTDASTLLITGAPTEGTNNFAILGDTGDSQFGGDLILPASGSTPFLTFRGDLNTGIGPGSVDDQLVFYEDGNIVATLDSTGLTFTSTRVINTTSGDLSLKSATNSAVVVNQDNVDIDFRVEGSSGALFEVNGGTQSVSVFSIFTVEDNSVFRMEGTSSVYSTILVNDTSDNLTIGDSTNTDAITINNGSGNNITVTAGTQLLLDAPSGFNFNPAQAAGADLTIQGSSTANWAQFDVGVEQLIFSSATEIVTTAGTLGLDIAADQQIDITSAGNTFYIFDTADSGGSQLSAFIIPTPTGISLTDNANARWQTISTSAVTVTVNDTTPITGQMSTHGFGAVSYTIASGSQTITTAATVRAQAPNSATAALDITSAIAFSVQNSPANVGTVAQYGLHIANLTSGATDYGVYIAGADTTALWVDSGTTALDGNVVIGGTIVTSGGGSLTGTWTDLGTVTTVDINGGTLDGAIIGGTTPAAATLTTLNATGGGALTGTWADLGTVTTIDINGGTIDGTTIGADSASTIIGTTIDATTDFTVGDTIIASGTIDTTSNVLAINGGDGVTIEGERAETIRLYKTSTQTKSLDASCCGTSDRDTDLEATLGAGEEWQAIYSLFIDAVSITPDLKFDIDYTGTFTVLRCFFVAYNAAGGTDEVTMVNCSDDTVIPLSTTDVFMRLYVTIKTTTAGDLEWRWTQNTSSSDTISIQSGSNVVLDRIS